MNTEQTTSEMPNIEQNSNIGIEATPIAENMPSSTAQVTQAQDDDATATKLELDSNLADDVIPETVEVHAESDITTTQDSDWANRVREVIRDDSGMPFKEEQDSEKLQEDYMKSRFNIDLDSPEGK